MIQRRSSRMVTLVPMALVALALSSAPAASAQTETEESTDETPEVELLDRGEAPRRALRYTVPASATQTQELRTYSNVSQKVGEDVQSGGTPNVRFTIEAVVPSVDDQGNLTVSYTYSKIEVSESGPTAVVEQTRDLLEPLIGVTGTYQLSSRGAVSSSVLDLPPGLDPAFAEFAEQLQSQQSQLSVPFPERPIGDGARWRSTTKAEIAGVTFRQRSTYTLEKDSAGRVTLAMEIDQRAPRQRFTPIGSDEEVTLLSSRAKGTGTTILEPAAAPLPTGGSSDIEVRQRLRAVGRTLHQTTRTSLFVNEER